MLAAQGRSAAGIPAAANAYVRLLGKADVGDAGVGFVLDARKTVCAVRVAVAEVGAVGLERRAREELTTEVVAAAINASEALAAAVGGAIDAGFRGDLEAAVMDAFVPGGAVRRVTAVKLASVVHTGSAGRAAGSIAGYGASTVTAGPAGRTGVAAGGTVARIILEIDALTVAAG